MKCTILPVITGATETVTKDLKKKLELITGKYSVDSVDNKELRTLNITKFTESTTICNWKPEPL